MSKTQFFFRSGCNNGVKIYIFIYFFFPKTCNDSLLILMENSLSFSYHDLAALFVLHKFEQYFALRTCLLPLHQHFWMH